MTANVYTHPVPRDARRLPGPAPMPILGAWGNRVRFFADPVAGLLRLHEHHGRVAALTASDPSFVAVFGAEHNRRVLSDRDLFHNGVASFGEARKGTAMRRLDTSLPFMNGERHKQQRKLIAPVFAKEHVRAHRDDIVRIAADMLERVRVGATIDVVAEMVSLSVRVALRCIFGVDAGTEAYELGRLGVGFLEGVSSLGVQLLPYDIPGTPYHRHARLCERLEGRLLALIQERRRQGAGGVDALSVLVRARDEHGVSLTDTELLGQTNVLFVGGYETTAHTLAWTLFLLSQHPRVLADLQDELRAQLRGDAPTVDQLGELILLDAVVKESMRLFPATPLLFFRHSTAAFELGPYILPAGSSLVLSPLVTHRIPESYPAPRRFVPERWSSADPSPYEYLPFGAGPRLCVGVAFASLEIRIVLAMILQRVRLDLAPAARVSRRMHGINMGFRHGLLMRVKAMDDAPPPSCRVRGDVHDLVDLD